MADVRRSPGPIGDVWEWQLRGACRGLDSARFFHPEGERDPARTRREEGAKAVCRTCPVIAECRQHALVVREQFGIWGGLSESEREVLVRSGSRRVALPASRPVS